MVYSVCDLLEDLKALLIYWSLFQVIVTMSPVILWNIMAKNQLLAILKATDEFLEDLHEMVSNKDDLEEREVSQKAQNRMRQFHNTCVTACTTSRLARIAAFRVCYEICLDLAVFLAQFKIYDHQDKIYYCSIPELSDEAIMCTVPTLDLLDMVWSINVTCILIALLINLYAAFLLYRVHYSNYQPKFYNNLPYGDLDDFNENVVWTDPWVKDSYLLLTKIFLENNPIMTKSYVLQAMKPSLQGPKSGEAGAKLKDIGKKASVYENALDALPEELLPPDSPEVEPLISKADESQLANSSGTDVVLNGSSSSGQMPSNKRVRHRVIISTRVQPVIQGDPAHPDLQDYTVLTAVLLVIPLFLSFL